MKLIFATQNQHKRDEVQAILGNAIELISLRDLGFTDELPETHLALDENAIEKARFIHEKFNENCFAEDTGLEVIALAGAPGVFSARYAGESKDADANIRLLLKNMEGINDRRARFRTVIALVVDNQEFLFEGEIEGTIATIQSGHEGFGYDPVFIPENHHKTFAEMGEDEKNRISHRAKAVTAFNKFLSHLIKS